MSARTPGPWRRNNDDHYTAQVWTDESHGSVKIAECAGMDRDANAAFIVEACNSYDDLLRRVADRERDIAESLSAQGRIAAQRDALAEALQRVSDKLQPCRAGERNGAAMGMVSQADDIARAALARVKGD